MLKKFFISMLGTMAGLWISLFLIFFGGLMLAGIFLGKNSDGGATLQKNSVLHFKLDGEVLDREQIVSFQQLILSETSDAPTLEQMIASLKAAVSDKNIKGLYLDCRGAAMAPADREELMEAIYAFKKSGKWIYAYSDNYTQGDYMLASAADVIALNPVGAVDIHGVGSMVPFYKGLLDKVGVKVQVLKVGTYKSAVEPYILDKISEPARQQVEQYTDTIWSYIAGTIAANRNMPDSLVRSLASEMIFTRTADTFVPALADTLLYARTVPACLAAKSGLGDEDPRLITPAEYLSTSKALAQLSAGKRHIAVLYAIGNIYDSGKEGIVTGPTVEDITELADDDNVAGLVLRVNSPGGSAFASEQIWSALEYFKSKDKPYYVSMGGYAASGGYYISCGADSIFADRTTITGSIGVFGLIPDLSGLLTGKLGLTFSTVETNPNAIGLSALEAMTPQQYRAMQQSVENIYDLFTKRVAEGRGMTQDDVKKIAEGRVWVGADALKLGLVDRLGSLDTTIKAMAAATGLNPEDFRSYPAIEEEIWEQLLRKNVDFSNLKAASGDPDAMRCIDIVRKLRKANPVQALMPEVIIK